MKERSIISNEGIKTDPEKISAITDWPKPANQHDIQSFLGLANYYRKFVPGFSRIAKPLTDLLKNSAAFEWKQEHDQAFESLKRSLEQGPVLKIPDCEKPFRVETDASNFAIGAALLQEHGGKWLPCAFISKKLDDTETRYSAYERELLAVIHALKTWRHINTDHKTLKHLMDQKELNSRQMRWLDLLQEFDVNIQYLKGKDNTVADSLSRRPDHRLNAISSVTFDFGIDMPAAYKSDKRFAEVYKALEKSRDDPQTDSVILPIARRWIADVSRLPSVYSE